MTESAAGNPNTGKEVKKKSPIFLLVVMGLTLVAGAAGFFVGYSQTFVAVEGGATGLFGTGLKKQYFLHTRGHSQAPYTVAVHINGHKAATFSTSGKVEEITDYVIKGRNKILFEAKRLPESMYAGHAWIEVELVQGKRARDGGYKDGQVLLRYERKAKDDADFRDEMDWETVSE